MKKLTEHVFFTMNNDSRQSLFPVSIFFVYLAVLCLMSGGHSGILRFMDAKNFSAGLQTLIPILYWAIVASGLTIFTRWKIRKTYDEPMRRLAEATDKVAHGDFSILFQRRTPSKNRIIWIL